MPEATHSKAPASTDGLTDAATADRSCRRTGMTYGTSSSEGRDNGCNDERSATRSTRGDHYGGPSFGFFLTWTMTPWLADAVSVSLVLLTLTSVAVVVIRNRYWPGLTSSGRGNSATKL